MTAGGGGDSTVPAGFTYLGQFVDHDLTFDRTKVMLGENVSPAELLQARSPALDLDSLYGAGPQNAGSAKFYTDDRHLKTGTTDAVGSDAARAGFDLPRAGTGPDRAAKRAALIPDPRNDENLAVAQTHAAFIRFHNRVVDRLPAATPAAQRFSRARELVVKHYQWMLRHDYLPRICAPAVLDDVFAHGRKVFEVHADPTSVPTMPVEFSIAAFRLGHSMIRRAYDWNARFPDGQGTLDLLFTFSGVSGNLGGGLRLPSNWIADFRRLYDFADAGRPDLTVPAGQSNRAMRIDTSLVHPLANLPTGSFGGPAVAHNDLHANLAFRNLTRAKMVRLATGQQMVAHLKSHGVPVTAADQEPDPEGHRRRRPQRSQPHSARRAGQEHPAVVLRAARGRGPRWPTQGRRSPHRRRDPAPRDGRKHVLHRPGPHLAAQPRAEQHHLPDGRSAAVRLRREEEPARTARLTVPLGAWT